ncbi:MAG: ribonuclease HII [Flavobacteriales bacterium]|nr:ribonuclease HII [Flavobacteriales bacterium]
MLATRLDPERLEAGCDEVGRGCLAGPVVAASVILPPDYRHAGIMDSKMLSERKRLAMVDEIKAAAIAWAVSFVEPVIIDRINILNASFLAMNRAVHRLEVQPEHLLIDGNRFKTTLDIGFTCIVKGDQKNASIAAASILAKTYRDEYMKAIHLDHPHFGWNNNVGYPTAQHRSAIANFGPTSHHRKSFRLLPDQLALHFAD